MEPTKVLLKVSLSKLRIRRFGRYQDSLFKHKIYGGKNDLGTDPIYNGDLGLDPDPFNYTIDSQSYIFINTLNDVGRTK